MMLPPQVAPARRDRRLGTWRALTAADGGLAPQQFDGGEEDGEEPDGGSEGGFEGGEDGSSED